MIEPTVDELAGCPGLTEPIQRLSEFGKLDRPLLIRGEVTTVRLLARAVAPKVVSGQAMVEVFCRLAGESPGALVAAVQSLRDQLAMNGALLMLEVDSLARPDRQYVLALARHRVLNARGDRLLSRLILQFDSRHTNAPFPAPPGLFLEVDIPPLGERSDDALHLLGVLLKSHLGLSLSETAADALSSYGWPGDLPELMGVVERLAAHGVRERSSSPTCSSPRTRRKTPRNDEWC